MCYTLLIVHLDINIHDRQQHTETVDVYASGGQRECFSMTRIDFMSTCPFHGRRLACVAGGSYTGSVPECSTCDAGPYNIAAAPSATLSSVVNSIALVPRRFARESTPDGATELQSYFQEERA